MKAQFYRLLAALLAKQNTTFYALVCLLSFTNFKTAAQSLPLTPNGIYIFVNRNSGLALSTNKNTNAVMQDVLQTTDYRQSSNQQFNVTFPYYPYPLAKNNFLIWDTYFQPYLDVAKGSTAPGAAIVHSEVINAARQEWKFVETGDGFVYIVNLNSSLVLDVAAASKSAGAGIVQQANRGSASQQWKITKVTVPVVTPKNGYPAFVNKTFVFINRLSKRAMGLETTDPYVQQTQVVQKAVDTTSVFQQWKIVPAQDTLFYQIVNVGSGRALNVFGIFDGRFVAFGATTAQYPSDYLGFNEQQYWKFDTLVDGKTKLLQVTNRQLEALGNLQPDFNQHFVLGVDSHSTDVTQVLRYGLPDSQWLLYEVKGGANNKETFISSTKPTVEKTIYSNGVKLRILPNPTRNRVQIAWYDEMAYNGEVSVLLIDNRGKTVQQVKTSSNTISADVSSLVAGVYTVLVTDGKKSLSAHLVVSK